MWSAIDSSAVVAFLATLSTQVGIYVLLLLALAGITIPLVFMRKGFAKIYAAIRLKI
jgi:hypothetical protein